MSGIINSENQVWIVVDESSYGTDAVDAAITANSNVTYLAVNSDSDINAENVFYRPNIARASQSGVAGTHIPSHGSGVINFPLRAGVGTPNTPNWGPLLKMCGFLEAVGASDTSYTLKTAIDQSATAYKYTRVFDTAGGTTQWRLQRLLGALGSFSLSATVGEEPIGSVGNIISNNYPEMTVDRAYFDSSDEPALDYDGNAYTYTGTASADTADKITCVSITCTVGGTTYPISSATLEQGMNVSMVGTMNGSTINARTVRTRGDNANAMGNLALETTDLAAALDDVLTKYQASTEAALVWVFANSTRKITVSCPAIQLMRPTKRANNGALGFDAGFAVNGDFGSAPFGDNGIVITCANV